MFKKIFTLSVLTIYAAFTIGCTSNGDRVEKLLNSDPSGGKWDLVKDPGDVKGFSVFKGPDGKFYAFNVDKYVKGMTLEAYKEAAGTVYSDLYKYSEVHREHRVGTTTQLSNFCPATEFCRETANGQFEYQESYDYWENVTYTYYKDTVSGLVFEQGDTTSKDLETLGATLEEENLASVKSALVSQFGLSETRASELASMASSMKNIADSQGRALTERDLESLQVKAMGASLADYKNAKAKNDKKAIEKMTAKAASMNKISPEQAKRLMKQLGL